MMVRSGTRDRLLEVADEALAELTPHELTLREIARRAGLSHGAPLRHYPSLAALLAALAADGFRDLHATIAARLDEIEGPRPPQALLRAAMSGYLDVAARRPGVLALMFRGDVIDRSTPELGPAAGAAFEQLVDLVRTCQAQGWHPDADPLHLAVAVWAATHGLAALWTEAALPPSVDTDLDHHLDVMVDVLAPAPSSAPTPSPTEGSTP